MSKRSPFAEIDVEIARALLRPGVVRNRRRRPIVTLAMDCRPETCAGWAEALDRRGVNATFYVDYPFPPGTDIGPLARRLAGSGHEFGLRGDPQKLDDLLRISNPSADGIELIPTAFAIAADGHDFAGRRLRARGLVSCRGYRRDMMTETIDLDDLPTIADPGAPAVRRTVLDEAAARRAWLVLALDARHPFGEADHARLDEILGQIRDTGLDVATVKNALGALAF